jgi:membrane protease YdiL (CAAX protease family)
MFLRIVVYLGWVSKLGDAGIDAFFTTGAQIIMMLLVPLIVFTIARRCGERTQNPLHPLRQTCTDFGFRRISGKMVGLSFLAGALLFIFNIFVATFFNSILSLFGYRFPNYGDSGLTGVWGLLFGLVFTAILPGLCEETTHRGMLLNSFRQKFGVRGALLFSSLMFGLMHLNIAQFFFATILGFFMGLAALVSRSIWPAVIMHFSNNAIVTYLGFAADNKGWLLGNFYDLLGKAFDGIPFAILIVLFFAIFIGRFILKIIQRFVVLGGLDAGTAMEFLAEHPKPKLTLAEKVFFYGALFLGAVTTIMTFVWGVM